MLRDEMRLAPDERNIDPVLVHELQLLISVPVLSTFHRKGSDLKCTSVTPEGQLVFRHWARRLR